MAWKIILFLPLLFQLLYCILSEEECPTSTFKTPNVGELVELDCSCGGFHLDWFYSSNGTSSTERPVYSGGPNERNYTFVVQNVSLGGRYRCVCGSCPSQCSECFYVSVTATLMITAFSIKPSIARVNDTLTMTCDATGYEPEFQLTKVGNATMVISELTRTGNGVVTAVTATLDHDGMFYCLVHNDYGGYDTASASVVVYVPPAIVGIQNFTVTNYSQQQTATLECNVSSQSSTDDVRWIRNGATIDTDRFGKYVFNNGTLMGHTLFMLSVRNLAESDVGKYLCQAGSKYNTSEDEVPVWILEGLGEEATDPPTVGPPVDEVDSSSKAGKIGGGLAAAIVVFAFVAIVAVIYYRWHYKKGSQDLRQGGDPLRDSADSSPTAPVHPRYTPAPGTNGTVTSRAGGGVGNQGEATAADNYSVGDGSVVSSPRDGSVVSSPRDGEEMAELPPQWSDDEETGVPKGVPVEVAYNLRPRKRIGS